MNLRTLVTIGATGLAMLPLLGSSCTKDKIVDLIITASADHTFEARGILNTYEDSATVDLKDGLDLAGVLADADIDPASLDPDALRVSRVYYRVVKAQAGRSIANGELKVQRQGSAVPAVLVSGFNESMAAVTDWVDITELLGAPGVTELNQFMAECVAELQGGPAVTNTEFTYRVSGTSEPLNVASDFDWAVKIQCQGKVPKKFNLPDF